MANRLHLHKPMLQVLANASPKMRKAILHHADKALIQTLSECVLNVSKGNVNMSECVKKKLKKYKHKFRSILNPKTRWNRKKRIFVQHGGFLSVLLPTLASIIPGLVSHFLSK